MTIRVIKRTDLGVDLLDGREHYCTRIAYQKGLVVRHARVYVDRDHVRGRSADLRRELEDRLLEAAVGIPLV